MLILFFLPVIKLIFCFFFNEDAHGRGLVDGGKFAHLVGHPVTRCRTRGTFGYPSRRRRLVHFFQGIGGTLPFRKGTARIFASNCSVLCSLVGRVDGTGRRVRLRFCVFRSSPTNELLHSILVSGTQRKMRIHLLCSSINY